VTSLPEDPPSLIGEDDRDTAVQRLQEAYTEGHISHGELDERLHQVGVRTAGGSVVSGVLSEGPVESNPAVREASLR
jgi:hypothetical protein